MSYSVSVHAQPYNFHRVVGAGSINTDGSLTFVYDWSSTSGNKNDLTSCYWHEYVTYPGPVGTDAVPNKYYPPNPPFASQVGVSWYPNPLISPGSGTQGGAMTGTNQVLDTQKVPPLTAPSTYTNASFTATQMFEFDDTATGQTDVQIPGPDSGPWSIVRQFQLYDAHDYQYSCTKSGKTSTVLEPF